MDDRPSVTTFLFTDIEGSTRLWEQAPERMRAALERHDALVRSAVESHGGVLVKSTGDGAHAAFDNPGDGIAAALAIQRALAEPASTAGVALRVRAGLHAGVVERRDNDYFGSAVNRAARIMAIAHGGQTLVSQTVADLVDGRLPAQVTLRDLGLVRLRDLSGAERVFQLAHPALRGDFPALRSLEAVPNNLPQQLTTFVRRERELVEVRKLLRATRLLTLCGTGGLGKTRLALQVAADALGEHPDGVWFVDLSPIADARLLPHAVASVLTVKEEAGRPVTEALLRFVKDRALLLILDNCEHLVEACAQLALQLLQAGPAVKVLATSREALRVPAETSYPVPALAFPAAGQEADAGSLLRYEAVRLFVERASAVQPAFRLTERNASAIVEICRQLDGIPLAIELAAARVRALSVETIAARIGDLFRRLPTGDRTALPRQQTLRALIDWSHDLLAPKEQALFRRLAVFAGGWTIEAAEGVCAGGDVAREDVLDLMTGLVDKSLVAVEHESGRYRLLETVRRYADERLRAAGEEEGVRNRHLEFSVAFAEAARPNLSGGARVDWLKRLDQDRENLISAQQWALRAAAAPDLGYRLVHAVKPYWFIRGLLNLGHRLTVEVASRSGSDGESPAKADAMFDAGQIAGFMGRYEESQRYLSDSLAIARRLSDERRIAAALQPLALAAIGQGDHAMAFRHCSEGLELSRRIGNKLEIAGACNALAQLHRLEGRLDAAEPLYEEVLALSRAAGNLEYVAVGLLNLAMVSIGKGARERVRPLLLEVLEIAEAAGSKPAGLSALEVSAGLAAISGDWREAARLYGVAEVQTREFGIRRDPADDAFLQPLVAKTRERMGDAEYAAAESAGRALTYEQAIGETKAWLQGQNA